MVERQRDRAPGVGDAGTVATTPNLSQVDFDDLVSSLDAIVWEADGDDYKMTYVSPAVEGHRGVCAGRMAHSAGILGGPPPPG
jgi:hypothetical protein